MKWEIRGKITAYDICGVKTWGIKRRCNKCGFAHVFIEDHGHYSFCPNCGEKNEEVAEECQTHTATANGTVPAFVSAYYSNTKTSYL